MERIVAGMEAVSDAVGNALRWFTLGMVLLGAGNALVRTADRMLGLGLTSNLWLEAQWYLFALVFLGASAWTLRTDGHVRVDVLYGRLGPRPRAWIDLVGGLTLMIPFCLLMLYTSWPYAMASWALREASPDPGGLARYPVKLLIPFSFGLLTLQALAFSARRALALFAPSTDAA